MALSPAQWLANNPGYQTSFYPGGAGYNAYVQYVQSQPKPIEQQTLQELLANPQEGDYYKNVLDTRLREQGEGQIGTAYEEAKRALLAQQGADVGRFQEETPFLQRLALGRLNARGLGTSVNTITGQVPSHELFGQPSVKNVYGYGSGALNRLAQERQRGLGDINLGYQNLLNELERNKAMDVNQLGQFYSRLATQRQQSATNRPGVIDWLKLPIAGVSALFRGGVA